MQDAFSCKGERTGEQDAKQTEQKVKFAGPPRRWKRAEDRGVKDENQNKQERAPYMAEGLKKRNGRGAPAQLGENGKGQSSSAQ